MHFLIELSLCLIVHTNVVYIPPTKTPPDRRGGMLTVYNRLTNSIVLFGGYSDKLYFNDIWSFSIKTLLWDEINPNSETFPCNY